MGRRGPGAPRAQARSRTDRPRSGDDRRPDALVAELAARGVVLDLCPTSNVQAAIVPSLEAHPLARLHRAGVPVTLSTDDLTVSDITLVGEYCRAVEPIGVTLPELWAIDRHAIDVAFADEATISRWRMSSTPGRPAIPELVA